MKHLFSEFSKAIFVLFLTILLTFQAFSQQAKYVFFFIGDGMGLAHVAATEAYLAAKEDRIGFDKLSFTKFPVVGLATTFAENRLITCSAAAGTALATGNKTTINTISMDGKRENAHKSIAEQAKEKGFKVGIISSVSIDHATPAVFYAHQPNRNNYYQISLELPVSGFDFFGGGGFKDPFYRNTNNTSVFSIAPENGYTITATKEDFYNLKPGLGKVIAIGTKLQPSGALRFAIDQTNEDIPLEDFVEKGIQFLNNDKGFFMMCEEGQIDWAAHANDGATTIKNVLSLSKAVEKALDFYQKHPDETLIIVTADHETGGFALGWAGTFYESNLKLIDQQKMSSYHFGLLADSRLKEPENKTFEFALNLVEEYFGLGGISDNALSERETTLLKDAFLAMTDSTLTITKEENELLYGGENPMAVTASRILNNRAGLSWGSWSHTAIPVPVFAIGVGQEQFEGYFDNTDIPKKIRLLMGLEK